MRHALAQKIPVAEGGANSEVSICQNEVFETGIVKHLPHAQSSCAR